MKRLKAMSNREWVQKHMPNFINEKLRGGVLGCPSNLGLVGKCGLISCTACWDMPAKRNGKYIMKVVKE